MHEIHHDAKGFGYGDSQYDRRQQNLAGKIHHIRRNRNRREDQQCTKHSEIEVAMRFVVLFSVIVV